MSSTNHQTFQIHDQTRQQVRAHYGAVAAQSAPSCCGPSSACCGTSPALERGSQQHAIKIGYDTSDLSSVPEGSELGLGCGNPTAIAGLKQGETVLDLGSGAGFDCFLAARKVGPSGKVFGVDMTPDMISKARRNAAEGGYPQVEFRLGEIEALPVADAMVDVILSNCVINLSPDKPSVFREAFRVLKPGGRLSIADVVATRPLPEALLKSIEDWSSCLGGAAQIGDLTSMLDHAGFQEILITPNEMSRDMISEWSQGEIRAGEYLVSALIEARKPSLS